MLSREQAMSALMVLFNPFAPERVDPYPTYAKIREAAGAFATPFGSVLITRYDACDKVLRSGSFRTPRGYRDANDPAGPPRFAPDGALTLHRRNWILFQTGEPHTRLRKLVTKVFTTRAVRGLTPRIDDLVARLLEPVLARGNAEVIADLAYPLPATVICELLGIPEADRERNRQWATAVAATIDPIITDQQVKAAETAMTEWDAYMRAFLAERRRTPGQALIDDMLAVEEDGARLTEDEIAANATFLFIAGHETTTNLIGNGLLALLRNPDQLAALRADPGLGDNAIEELLRFDSPVQFAARVAVEATEVEGVPCAPEVIVSVALGMANHDPRRFTDPDRLDLRRPDCKPLSFGGGPHYCIGAALARAEARSAFARLLAATSAIELAGEPKLRTQLSLRGLATLPIAVRAA
jgi:cytochrome P450